VLRPVGNLVVIELDGAASVEEFYSFTSLTRIPPGVRSAYVHFAMRTVASVAPTADQLPELVTRKGVSPWRSGGWRIYRSRPSR